MITGTPRPPRAGRWRLAAWVALPLSLWILTAAATALGANAATVGFLYFLMVLGLATWGGGAVGAVAAVTATLAYNYFFLPPHGTLDVAEPANWVALLCFLAAAALASRLVTSARTQAAEAERRRQDVEALYDLCFGLFAASQRPGTLGEACARTLRALGAGSGRLLLGDPAPGQDMEEVAVVGADLPALDPAALACACRERRVFEVEAEPETGPGGRTVYVPLDVGGRISGILVASDPLAPGAVLEAAGRLLALALERERLLGEAAHLEGEAAHLEAVRESEALKTSLLRAVSHDLRTPLTSIRMEIESLGRQLAGRPEAETSLRTLGLEQERLTRRIDNLLALARLDAGLARPRPEAVPPSSLFRAACESLALVLDGRPVETRVAPRCPDLWVDPWLALESVANLLENAARAAPAGRAIVLAAAPDPAAPGRVYLEVLDRGPGLPASVRHLFQGPLDLSLGLRGSEGSGDTVAGGLGLQIAGSFSQASGGTLALFDRMGGGTVARLDLPAAGEEAGELVQTPGPATPAFRSHRSPEDIA